jgi:hypothetical protein
MRPEDRERVQDGLLKIEQTLERNRVAIELAGRKSERYRRTLAITGAEIQSARSALRRLGYLR